MFRRTALVAFAVGSTLLAQQQPAVVSGAQFDVVSIKPQKDEGLSGPMRTLPDGTFIGTHVRIRQIISAVVPEPVDDFVGLPGWVMSDSYDIVAKPPADMHPTPEQRREMMRNMLIDRMKVAGHVEEQERTTFALVIVRSDGRLGPNLTRSTLDCAAMSAAGGPLSVGDKRCGMRMGPGSIVSDAAKIDSLAMNLRGPAGGRVTDRTGLDGFYAFTLTFAPPRLNADPTAPPDDAPSIFTALQEQLGLKLVPEKTKVKVFVIDHIERPTAN